MVASFPPLAVRNDQRHPDGEFVGIVQLVSICLPDDGPAPLRPVDPFGDGREGVAAADHRDPVWIVLLRRGLRLALDARYDQPPPDLQPIGPTRQPIGVRRGDAPPVPTAAVVPLRQRPQVVAAFDDVHVRPPVRRGLHVPVLVLPDRVEHDSARLTGLCRFLRRRQDDRQGLRRWIGRARLRRADHGDDRDQQARREPLHRRQSGQPDRDPMPGDEPDDFPDDAEQEHQPGHPRAG